MTQHAMAKQMLDANKATFDNAFRAMVMLQEQAEKMTGTLVEQAAWLPEEGKKAIREWIEVCKKGREEYKKTVDDAYKKLAELVASAGR